MYAEGCVSLFLSLELASQWSRIRRIGPVFPVTQADLRSDVGVGLGHCRCVLTYVCACAVGVDGSLCVFV